MFDRLGAKESIVEGRVVPVEVIFAGVCFT